MRKFEINEDQVNALGKFLSEYKYIEVFQAISMLKNLPVIPEEKDNESNSDN